MEENLIVCQKATKWTKRENNLQFLNTSLKKE